MLQIFYEDEALMVVEKPAGMPVYPLHPEEVGTLANLLLPHAPELAQVGAPLQAGTLHRLDNHTSGLIVVARTQEAHEKLSAQWNTPDVTKTYTALVVGLLSGSGTIAAAIAHHPRKKNKMVVDEKNGRPAVTHWKVVRRRENYSLLEVTLTTGVRHQIRVHLASIGHPLVGDRLYQNSLRRLQDRSGLDRQFLHLSRVMLKHPVTSKKMEFTSPLPPELQRVLNC